MRGHKNAAGLYPDEFRGWLERKQAGAIVGSPGLSNDCPLATYLNEDRGCATAVHRQRIFIGSDNFPTPTWACRFIDAVDEFERSIKAYEALAILDQIEAKK